MILSAEKPTVRVPRRTSTINAARDLVVAGRLQINHFHEKSSSHHPQVSVGLSHDDGTISLRFDVKDQYVLARATGHQTLVAGDSCVEFFVRPSEGQGYFNFEVNCGGTLLCYYITDWRRAPEGFVTFVPLTDADLEKIAIRAAMPQIVWPERREPTPWWVELDIPVAVLEQYVGTIGPLSGKRFRGNFYKCADSSSHPHWASWSPIGERLDFHQPSKFGELDFE
ncbi:MAG: hypothetical protein JWM57_2407 [Phycisphaerales bacterium]|nr:hypothetical protein [Phycisphaerales bacterium]